MDLIDIYEQYRAQNRKLRAPKTDSHYRIAIRHLTRALGRTPTIEDLSDASIIAMERHMADRSPNTTNAATSRLKALWRWCAQTGIVRTWPSISPLPAPEPYRRAWTVDQVRTLLAATDCFRGDYNGVPRSLWWRTYLLVLWDTGERSGAARALRFDWMTEDGIHVPAAARKGHKSHYYRLSPQTLEAIAAIRNPRRSEIFPWPLSDSSFFLHYRRLLVTAGMEANRKNQSQRMRRTHLTYWLVGGQDPSARAKHASRSTTEKHYIDESLLEHVSPDEVLPEL